MTKRLRVEMWKHDEDAIPWPKVIIEPDGTKHLPIWDESKIDLRPIMNKYIGQEIEIYILIGMGQKKEYVEKLVKVEKDGFETE